MAEAMEKARPAHPDPGTALATQDDTAPPFAAEADREERLRDDALVPDEGVRRRLLAELGTLRITKDKRAVLTAPTPPDIVAVKPTGEVYVPGVHYRRKLNLVFGPAAWALRPLTHVQYDARPNQASKKSTMYREYALVVHGRCAGVVIGETDYHPTNPRMTYGDAAESLRTNALTRLGKDLGIYSEVWDGHWSNAWRAQHCVLVWVDNKSKDEGDDSNRPVWRLVEAEPFRGEREPTSDSPNRKRWYELRTARGAQPAPAAQQAEQPQRQAPQQPQGAAAQADDVPREFVAAVRQLRSGKGRTIWGVRTSAHEYFTDSEELKQAAELAITQQRAVGVVSERREQQGQGYLWLLELRK